MNQRKVAYVIRSCCKHEKTSSSFLVKPCCIQLASSTDRKAIQYEMKQSKAWQESSKRRPSYVFFVEKLTMFVSKVFHGKVLCLSIPMLLYWKRKMNRLDVRKAHQRSNVVVLFIIFVLFT